MIAGKVRTRRLREPGYKKVSDGKRTRTGSDCLISPKCAAILKTTQRNSQTIRTANRASTADTIAAATRSGYRSVCSNTHSNRYDGYSRTVLELLPAPRALDFHWYSPRSGPWRRPIETKVRQSCRLMNPRIPAQRVRSCPTRTHVQTRRVVQANQPKAVQRPIDGSGVEPFHTSIRERAPPGSSASVVA
jgi:hypothetical protein